MGAHLLRARQGRVVAVVCDDYAPGGFFTSTAAMTPAATPYATGPNHPSRAALMPQVPQADWNQPKAAPLPVAAKIVSRGLVVTLSYSS